MTKERAGQVMQDIMRRVGCREGGLADMDARDMQRVILTVDDTDDTTKATSTGEIAGLIADEVPALGGAIVLGITRHQLLIAEGVPYTSHNSAMSFEALLPDGATGKLRECAIRIIVENRAETSDPGLCVAVLPESWDDEGREQLSRVVDFGWRAKEELCSIRGAYELAAAVPWLTLSEHGGNGDGVVGALAGVGLRLDGNDGRFRGKWDLQRICGFGEDVTQASVEDVVECLAAGLGGDVQVLGVHGEELAPDTPFALGKDVKPLLKGGKLTIVCEMADGVACPCKKDDLGEIGNVRGSWRQICASFTWDNDLEECVDAQPSCKNCLYRRWVAGGFSCVLPEMQADVAQG